MAVSKEMKELLESATPLKTHQELYIKLRGVLSGSVGFGVATEISDIDYILHSKQFYGLNLTIDNLRYSHDEGYRFDGYSSWYVKGGDGDVYNLLVAESDFVYNQYVYATKMVNEELSVDSSYFEKLRDKDFRVSQFQGFKKLYRELHPEEAINESNEEV